MAVSREGTQPLDVAVVEGLAEREGVDPTALDYSLQQYIDTDVIEALDAMGDRKGGWKLQFEVSTHTVQVDSENHVVIDGLTYQ
ncbi:MAG: HalOD1 output domain-containing protein [Haloferacaceae archaeon]